MNIYQVSFNKCDYDQYDSFIVIAESEQDAVKLVEEYHPRKKYGDVDWDGGYSVEEIELREQKEPYILLGSFNAG